MPTIVDAFYTWLSTARDEGADDQVHAQDVQDYFHGVSRARYVIRRVFRIVDELAKEAGLEPLAHQALIQVFGATQPIQVRELAERLDIPPGLASRLVKSLDEKGYVDRSRSAQDKRTTLVTATDEGRRTLVAIDTEVHARVTSLQASLSDLDRTAALGIFAFYLGAAPSREHFARLADVVRD